MPEKIALVTCLEMPEPDHDEVLLSAAFTAGGCDAETVAWDDPLVEWGSYRLAVVRSTWNYPEKEAEFRQWIVETAGKTRLVNPAEVMLGNIHKGYLTELAAQGVATVPTLLVRRGEAVEGVPFEGGLVVKPAVGAGSMFVRVFEAEEREAALGYLVESVALRDTLVQPVVPSVFGEGERALVWIGGQFTHKVVKRPRFDDDDESVSEGMELDAEDLEIGEAVARRFPAGVLYARVDVMRFEGRLVLSELELTEPSQFFFRNPSALDSFVSAVRALF